MKKYLYETHLHTSPVSKCAKSTVSEALEFYKKLGYAGVFITNHFIDGNINCDKTLSYSERINFYFSDYEEGLKIGRKIGISVFLGVESTYKGTDFLIYGLDKNWFLTHPEIEHMKKSEMLTLMREEGALIIHAHPFRQAKYIDHIRLFPQCVDGVEIYNAQRSDFENGMANHYAHNYNLIPFAGSDNHSANGKVKLGGMMTQNALKNEQDFIKQVKSGEAIPFRCDFEENIASECDNKYKISLIEGADK